MGTERVLGVQQSSRRRGPDRCAGPEWAPGQAQAGGLCEKRGEGHSEKRLAAQRRPSQPQGAAGLRVPVMLRLDREGRRFLSPCGLGRRGCCDRRFPAP